MPSPWTRVRSVCALTCAGLLGLPGVALAAAGTPPAVLATEANPEAVDVSRERAVVVVRSNLADAEGVAAARAVLTDAAGGTAVLAEAPMALESGTALAGTWSAAVTVPVTVRAASLRVSTYAADTAGAAATTSGPAVAVTSDATAPSYGAGTLTPTAVNVTRAAADVTVAVTASDAGTGVASVTASGAGSAPAGLTLADGTWTGSVTVPGTTPPGTYPVEAVVADAAGNETRRTVGDVVVRSAAGDSTAPALAALTATPDAVDVSAQEAVVTVTARLTDGGSGVGGATARLGGDAYTPLALVSGDEYDGTWSAAVTLPAGTPHGTLDAYVVAHDAAGNVAAPVADDALAVADAPPAAPSGLVLAGAGEEGSLRVSWSAPPANGGSPVTGYDVTVEPGATTSIAADARDTTLTGLADGTSYVVRVAARNAAGTGTAAFAVPDAPVGLVVTPGAGSLHAAWAGREGGSYDVAVSAAGTPVTSVRVTGSTADVPGLTNGTTYAVRVADAVTGLAAAPATVTPRTVPGAPRIGAVKAGNKTATVAWAAPASDGGAAIASYRVTAHPSGAVAVAPASARSVTVPRLANGAATTFSVVAVNVAGAGPASARSASVVPRQPARLVVAAQPAARVVHGTGSSVRAGLVTDTGTAIPGARIELWARIRPATTWKRVAYGSTGTGGQVTLRTTLPATSSLQLRHPLGATVAPDLAVRGVTVATRLHATASATSIRLGSTLTVTGPVGPAHPAGSAVYLQRYVSGAWRNVATGKLTSTTAYKVAWKPGTAASYRLRVMKPADADHASGASQTWTQTVRAESTADVAKGILAISRIKLETVHTSGVRDLANARQNVVDVAAGRLARRSAYQNAPGGYTTLDLRMLKAIRRMGQLGSITVTELAGGSHSRGSTHYYGRGLDISWVNGQHVYPGTNYRMAVDVCRQYGAVRVFSPAYDPYGGHSNHVHCDW